ncbi:germination protein [Pullulanibacillus camelliae]|uniref:Germination protein n=1 Tax=Pullulanibacillus camelliae TaxID=1707096 RepID=A0A8J2YN66_9BACL|nr:spore germination lipoprotein GerD [Pullulanibacillus camelliae]GGE54668.1 germination protein [Pullulanibacillus camelliae]
MKTLRRTCYLFLFIFLVTGCSSQPSTQGNEPDYQATKKMVIDMLKSDEGKKALQDILGSEQFQKQLVMNQDFVKKTITDSLTSDKSKALWTQMIADPEFSNKLAQTMQKNNEKILKQLMKDPSYQQSMMSILKAPELQDQYLDLLATEPFRKQIQKEIIETMESPLFRTQITQALESTVKEEMKKGNNSEEQKASQASQ